MGDEWPISDRILFFMTPVAGIVSIGDVLMPCADPFFGGCPDDRGAVAAGALLLWLLASLVTLGLRSRWRRRGG